MLYSLGPTVALSSKGNRIVLEDNHSRLFDLNVEADIHLALLQILLAGVDFSELTFKSCFSELADILKQLEDIGLVRVVKGLADCQFSELPNTDLLFCAQGFAAGQLVAQLGVNCIPREQQPTLSKYSHIVLVVESAIKSRQIIIELNSSRPTLVCEISYTTLSISPTFSSESGLSVQDWITRRLAASWWPEQMQQRLEANFPLRTQENAYPASQQTALLDTLLQKSKGELAESETRIDRSGQRVHSMVLKIPTLVVPEQYSSLPVDEPPVVQKGIDEIEAALVSKYVGLVRELDHLKPQKWWPSGLKVVEAKISDIEAVLGWPADRIAAGASWDDPKMAVAAALGEAVERYCGNAIPSQGFESATYTELQNRRLNAIDPTTFALFSDEQYAAEGFPFVPFTRDLKADWVWGKSLLSHTECLAPAQLTYVNWYYVRDRSLPTNVTMFAGIAAGPGRDFAECSALEEIIERDAAHQWWHGRLEAKSLSFKEGSLIANSLETFKLGWRFSLFSIASSTMVPVMGCLLLDEKQGLLSLGIASRLNAETAALKAIAEAVQLHEYAQGLLNEDGNIWKAVKDKLITGKNLKAVRTDRRYLDSYRKDFHDVVDLPCQMQVYLDPRAHNFVEELWSLSKNVTTDQLSIPYYSLKEQRQILIDAVSTESSDIVSVDLTTAEIAKLGLSVVRVLAPGMYGNSPTAFPYFGGKRLESAVKKSHESIKDWHGSLRLEPPPYA